MTNPVIDAIQRLLPNTRPTSRGFIQVHCPSCGDKKRRGGFVFTSTGGFRYNCFNAGCEIQKTGWEPENGFFGRPRRLFEMLGGSISDIPVSMLIRKAVEIDPIRALEVAREFPPMTLPEGSRLLWGESLTQDMRDCQTYVLSRGTLFVEYPFFWSAHYPRHVIYPFEHHKKIIGWIARAIDEDNTHRHVKCQNWPTDYMLNQDHAYRCETVFVQEGVFDAVSLNSLCTFGSTISRKQVNMLRQLKSAGRKVILLPDQKGDEWIGYWNVAKANGFLISVPEYPNAIYGIKDVCDSIKRNGLLLTAEAVIAGVTDNHLAAHVLLKKLTRG